MKSVISRSLVHSIFISVSVLAICIACLPSQAQSVTVTEFPICTADSGDYQPAISGNTVVWEYYRTGESGVYGYDLSTHSQFAIHTVATVSPFYYPEISGNTVVWYEKRNGNTDIYGYDLSTHREFRITTNAATQWDPAISDDTVVWMDYRNGLGDIYGYNLSTHSEFPVCTASGHQWLPAISGDTVVWHDDREGNIHIYGYDLSTHSEFPIYSGGGGSDPAISGNTVVWAQWDQNIYGYDLSTHSTFPICTHAGTQWKPAISDNIVVWEDLRNLNWDIYGYDLSTHTEFPICTNTADQHLPAISGNTVVWEDYRNGVADIYGATIDYGTPLPPPPAHTILSPPLPVYEQRGDMPNSCAVVSAAMVMGYWDNHGFPDLISGNSGSQDSNVNAAIDQLANGMLYIPAVGTIVIRDGSGMQTFFNSQEGYTSSYYYSSIASEQYSAGVMTFDLLTGVIDSSLPLLLYTRLRTDPGQIILPCHTIFVYGYQDNPGDDDDWVAVYDTWGSPSLSNNPSSIPAKIEDGIEWWRWTPIDTSGPDFLMWEALVFQPFHGGANSTYNRRDSFGSQENFDELYITVSGTAVVTESPIESSEFVLQLSSPDSTPALMYTYICGAPTLGISFECLFDTSGKLRIYLDDVLLDTILAPENGPGAPGSDMMMTYSQWFNLADYGLDPEGSFELRFELTDPVDPIVYMDDVTVLYTSPIPEPGTMAMIVPALLSFAGIAFRKMRK